jgi:hypothetical protein
MGVFVLLAPAQAMATWEVVCVLLALGRPWRLALTEFGEGWAPCYWVPMW